MARNRANRDAVLVLARDGMPDFAIYVRAGEQVQILHVPTGDYDVRATFGRRWRDGRFETDPAYVEMAAGLPIGPSADAGHAAPSAPVMLALPATPTGAGFRADVAVPGGGRPVSVALRAWSSWPCRWSPGPKRGG